MYLTSKEVSGRYERRNPLRGTSLLFAISRRNAIQVDTGFHVIERLFTTEVAYLEQANLWGLGMRYFLGSILDVGVGAGHLEVVPLVVETLIGQAVPLDCC